jgi:leucyl-tRNA---protein transferase
MTDLSSLKLSTLKLFATQPHPCSYLDGEQATTVFVDPSAEIDLALYTQLSQLGFRRSGAHLYRPQCATCQACLSCRVPVELFKPNRHQKRCIKKNADLDIQLVQKIDTEEHYQLYALYIEQRHSDGDMYPPTQEQFKNFLAMQWETTGYLEFRLNGQLISLAVCDQLNDGLSAVYTFYDAAFADRSLGKFAVLAQIQRAKDLGLPHLYLGYWIKDCDKMNYKSDYRPLDLLINRRWMRLN